MPRAGIMRVPLSPLNPSKTHSSSIPFFHPPSPQLRCTSHEVHHHHNATHLHTLLTTTTSNRPNPKHATQIHAQLITTNSLPIPLLHTQLINLYAKSGQLPQALLTFKTTREHSNVVTWTSLITHLAQSHQPFEALSLFAHLKREGLGPNPYTFSAVLPACAETRSVLHGSQVHGLACKHGVDADVFVASALADTYAKCGDMHASKRVFDEMPRRNLVSWNAIIVGFVRNKLYDEAVWMFRALLVDGSASPDQVSISSVLSACANSGGLGFGGRVHAHVVKLGLESVAYVKNSLIDMYSKCGRFEEASGLFDIMNERDVVAWNTMMTGWVQNDHFEEACSCFQAMMREEILPDEASFSTVLHASASLAAWGQGAAIHTLIIKTGFGNNQCAGSSLITMYAKCGSLDDAYRSFQEMKHHQNVVSWTAMIAAFQQHGHANRVIELFDRMLEEGMEPDYVTFVCILSACSHSGLIEQGFRYFTSMSQVHNMAPGKEHYACMVDMLARAGRLAEAKQFIDTMPIKPDASVWGALLGACGKSGNLELGKEVARRLFEIEPDNPGNYVLLANLYARHGRLEEAKEVRRLMGYNGVRKETGCSWIDVKNKTYVFTVHDQSHPRTRETYEMLRRMEELVRVKGYVADIQFAVNDVGEYKEQSLWYHSERLALAFGLISLPMDAPIRIKKNLRTCGDCHTVMKLASGIFSREIVLRDTNRFHRFAGGSCSCGDYW
ncbi:putative pentatricopeptide repeat-containing protein At5g52630 [Phoenix dactylifera]|uniref:Pentatricopeptide repeat-containing protein At5g52630 n=1 Tax=Phoenix dactylifera TaxID=42345 RepID=A0A8B7CJM2_PHODC|nr:putative pentatricopeptide repeat-containing protein At5g52630 [Phoenix dactylifera]